MAAVVVVVALAVFFDDLVVVLVVLVAVVVVSVVVFVLIWVIQLEFSHVFSHVGYPHRCHPDQNTDGCDYYVFVFVLVAPLYGSAYWTMASRQLLSSLLTASHHLA